MRTFHSPLLRRTAVVPMLVALCFVVLPSRLAANNLHKIDELARECQSGKQKACNDLAKIALTERNWSVRMAAVRMLTDQQLLAKIALEGARVKGHQKGDTSFAALEKLTDQPLLAKIALESRHPAMRQDAAFKVTDQALLAKIATDGTDAWVSGIALDRLTDRVLLTKIALEAASAPVRSAAVVKLTDQALLARIAVEDKDAGVRNAALTGLQDQTSLAKIALEAAEASVRSAAAARMTDQAVLARIAVEDKDAGVRNAALAGLQDQTSLTKIALEVADANMRSAAAIKLTDQAVLARIAVEDKDGGVRNAALAALKDQTFLTKIALEAADANVRRDAAVKLTDQAVLARIAVDDKDADVRRAAVASAQQIQRDTTPEGRDIVDLLAEKKIEIQALGNGIQRVSVKIRRLVPYPLTVRIPVGSFFAASNSSAQNMVATSETKVILTTDEWVFAAAEAACANRPRKIPGDSDTFTVLRSPNQAELARLMPVLEGAHSDIYTRQAAVWIVTDNANYADLGTLVVHALGGIGGRRVINEPEVAWAMKICDQAGINLTKKAIWNDRQRVIDGLKDGDLKKWIVEAEREAH